MKINNKRIYLIENAFEKLNLPNYEGYILLKRFKNFISTFEIDGKAFLRDYDMNLLSMVSILKDKGYPSFEIDNVFLNMNDYLTVEDISYIEPYSSNNLEFPNFFEIASFLLSSLSFEANISKKKLFKKTTEHFSIKNSKQSLCFKHFLDEAISILISADICKWNKQNFTLSNKDFFQPSIKPIFIVFCGSCGEKIKECYCHNDHVYIDDDYDPYVSSLSKLSAIYPIEFKHKNKREHGHFLSLHKNRKICPPAQTLEEDVHNKLKFLESKNKEKLLASIQSMHWVEFEKLIASILKKKGYSDVVTTQQTVDGGIDGYMKVKGPSHDFQYIMQAKRYQEKNKVPLGAINEFIGVMDEKHIYNGLFFTTSEYTSGALERKAKFDETHPSSNLVLYNGKDIVDLMWDLEIGVKKPVTYKVMEVDDDFFAKD